MHCTSTGKRLLQLMRGTGGLTMAKYKVVDSRGFEFLIESNGYIWSRQYNNLSFYKDGKNIASFNTNNIIGFYETQECDQE
jgi:ligand-binding sensor domain-containing protein